MENNEQLSTKDRKGGYLSSFKAKLFAVIVFTLLAIGGLILSSRVKINYNLADYLADDTETSIGLKIMTEEFEMSGNIQVMLTNIKKPAAKEVYSTLSSIDGVLSVAYDENSPASYKEDSRSALFNIVVNGDDSSESAQNVIKEIKERLGNKYGAVELGGTTIEYSALRENTTKEMGFIIAFALTLATIILILTASSWLDPVILLLTSGIAIAINMGLNLILGEISYITNSVGAILQLALSVDYSVMLMHEYRDQKKLTSNSTDAMRKTLKMVVSPVSASALTTVAGLVALLFMSFTIGFDIGIVLIKGIVVSAITSVTLLPAVILLLDPILEKTAKRPFIPKGSLFSGLALKLNKVIVPVVALAIVASAILQIFNSYSFTDSLGANKKIEDTFGRNETVVVLYKNGERESDYEKELKLQSALSDYKNKDGVKALASYTAYSNTVREVYTVERAASLFGLPEDDVEILFTMYNLYSDKTGYTLTPSEFVAAANALAKDDPDAKDLVTDEIKTALELLNIIKEAMPNVKTSGELYDMVVKILPNDSTITKDGVRFLVNQMYGLYFYEDITVPKVKVRELLRFAADNIFTLYDSGVLTKELVGDEAYNIKAFISLYLLTPGDNSAHSAFLNKELSYDEFLTEFKKVSSAIYLPLPEEMELPESYNKNHEALVKQLYIWYFNYHNLIPTGAISGRELAECIKTELCGNPIIDSRLGISLGDTVDDLISADEFISREDALDYSEMCEEITAFISGIKTMEIGTELAEDMISGIYIKSAAAREENELSAPITSYQLVNFLNENIETNSLLSSKISEENKLALKEASKLMADAADMFSGDKYSRIILSAVVPAEGPEMKSFVEYLLKSIKDIFGDDAHITGQVVSTYDLQEAFAFDNTLITVFTIISILLVILFVFKSLSLPVILVLIIQGAVWLSLSFQLITGTPIFFMSYIMTSCILMGATVDYGILMSSNYLVYRRKMDKTEALRQAVDSAMPTVFTSGTVLIVCGFVISLVSSQDSIASVGLLLALGAITSIIMITVALPSVLYLLDGFVLKLTLAKKEKK